MTKNRDIRIEIAVAGLKQWQVAKALGIAEATFSRKLREELPEEEKVKILAAIKSIGEEAE